MEPPAKRLRIMQSVEVDESNPEYIAAKAKANAKLKNKFESIFAKYQVMPEAMTDEIDIRTGEIVVDRGHLRKLDKEYRRRRKPGQGLLDDLIADQLADQLEDDDEEGEEEDVRDELAPSMSPEPREQKHGKKTDSVAQSVLPPPNVAPPGQQIHQVDIPPTAAQATSAPLSAVPSPVVDWTQFLQFPQTPAGQLAQNTFVAQITQAVQQAVTPIISNLMSSASSALPHNNMLVLPALAQSAANSQDTTPVIPSTPNIFTSPRLPEAPLLPLSSPVPDERRPLRRVARGVYITRTRRENPRSAYVKPGNCPAALASTEAVKKSSAKSSSPPVQRARSPNESHHLPTPSSIEQNRCTHRDRLERRTLQDLSEIIASGGHFDEDERDLLSIADEEHTTLASLQESPVIDMTIKHTPTKECMHGAVEEILPSVETELHSPHHSLPKTTPPIDNSSMEKKLCPPTPVPSKPKPKPSSATTARKPKPKPPKFQLDSDSDIQDDLDLNLVDSVPCSKRKRESVSSWTPPTFSRRPRRLPSKSASAGKPSHTSSPPTTNNHPIQPVYNTKREGDAEAEDELATPIRIKRESQTPSLSPLSSHRIIPSIESTHSSAFRISTTTTTTTTPHSALHLQANPTTTTTLPSPSTSYSSFSTTTTTTTAITTPPATRRAADPRHQHHHPHRNHNSNKNNNEEHKTRTASSSSSSAKLTRSAFLRKVKQSWAREGRKSGGGVSVGAGGGGVFGTPRKTGTRVGGGRRMDVLDADEDSEDELAV